MTRLLQRIYKVIILFNDHATGIIIILKNCKEREERASIRVLLLFLEAAGWAEFHALLIRGGCLKKCFELDLYATTGTYRTSSTADAMISFLIYIL